MGNFIAKDKNENIDKITLEIDEEVKDQIDKISEYVKIFNTNDAHALLEIVKDYKLNLETLTNRQYDLGNIDKFVTSFHQELLNKISSDNPRYSNSEKRNMLKQQLKENTKLPEYLKNMYDESLEKKKTEIMSFPLIAKDNETKKNVDALFTNITSLKSKYKYFEYRYIQLNLFLIIYTQHTFTTMDNFVNNILFYIKQKNDAQRDAIKKLIALLLQIMNQAELTIDQKNFEVIDDLMSVMEKQLLEKEDYLSSKLESTTEKAKGELLDVLDRGGVAFANSSALPHEEGEITDPYFNVTEEDIEKFKKTPYNARTMNEIKSASAIPPQYNGGKKKEHKGGFLKAHSVLPEPFYDKSQKGGNVTREQNLRGGFLRDHSVLSQSFYELNR